MPFKSFTFLRLQIGNALSVSQVRLSVRLCLTVRPQNILYERLGGFKEIFAFMFLIISKNYLVFFFGQFILNRQKYFFTVQASNPYIFN